MRSPGAEQRLHDHLRATCCCGSALAGSRHATGRQAWSVTLVGILTIPQRLGSSLVVVVGIAGVVGVLVAVLAMAAGFASTLRQTGSDDTAIVMRAGAQTEINSVLDHDSATLVSQLPQVLRDAQGLPIASPELVVIAASLPKKSTGLDANVGIARGRRARLGAATGAANRGRAQVSNRACAS